MTKFIDCLIIALAMFMLTAFYFKLAAISATIPGQNFIVPTFAYIGIMGIFGLILFFEIKEMFAK